MEEVELPAFRQAMIQRLSWIRIWESFEDRILRLPAWMQLTLLRDMETAVSNRIAVMEKINRASKSANKPKH